MPIQTKRIMFSIAYTAGLPYTGKVGSHSANTL
uniref:Uncharacterized protein n=1 Tax=Anguilla anguilla TaxID=7936 RepID=A0A0E9RM88_ANGAN